MPRALANPDMSPNGSIATVVSGVLRRKADWPYHSTCMLLLLGCGLDDCDSLSAAGRAPVGAGAARGGRPDSVGTSVRGDGQVGVGRGRIVILTAPHQRC